MREVASNVGNALQRAMREIEKANPDSLYGVFGDAQWANKDRLSDALLKDLIEHFSRLSFGNENINSDLLGDAYEYLIKKFADATNKKAGEFYTPRSVVRLMVEMLDPREGETIYDPACGTGGMLLAAVQHVKDRHGDVKRLWGKLFGQEKNLTTSSIARMNLFLHGIEDFQIVRGDTLRNPAFFEVDRLAHFDCVIANPPFSLEKWGEEMWINDPFGRNFAGLPPSSSGDFAWVQHMVKSMAEVSGRMAVVLPQGALFRKGAEGTIRQKLLEMDLVEAVIGLAPNLFYGTGLAACILVLRKKKPVSRRKKVMIADASRLFRRGRAQNYLEPEHALEIQNWFEKFEDAQLANPDAVRIVSRSPATRLQPCRPSLQPWLQASRHTGMRPIPLCMARNPHKSLWGCWKSCWAVSIPPARNPVRLSCVVCCWNCAPCALSRLRSYARYWAAATHAN